MSETWRRLLWPEAAVWVALMALLGLTIAAAYAPLGAAGIAVNLAIAGAKALLVATFFMHLRHGSALNRLAATLGVLWLALLLALTVADVLAR